MRKAFLMSVSILVLAVFLAAAALSAEYWASKKSDKYHFPTCEWAKKISPENLVRFATPEDAVKAGFMPCKVCQPPPGKRP